MTFTPTDAANYTTATTTVSINVGKATPIITWPTPADIVYGTALSATQLNATDDTSPARFVYTPAAGVVLSAGTHSAVGHLHADRRRQLHDGDRKSVSINVAKATPIITWATPADIVYGTALSATQLNATDDRRRARSSTRPAPVSTS